MSRPIRDLLLALAVLCVLPTIAASQEKGAARPPEPTLAQLQRAAVATAHLEPERIRSIERRLRASALLPQVRVRVGRGDGQLQTVTDYDGTARLSVGDNDAWSFDLSAGWNLDRLLFHPDELRLSREAERAAVHRERLLREVAELYSERERVRAALELAPPASPLEVVEARLRLDELTAMLDAISGGAISAAQSRPAARIGLSSPPARARAAPGHDTRPGSSEEEE